MGMLAAGACQRSHAADSKAAKVDQLFSAWNRTDSPGCAVGISQNGVVVYEHGYGMANLELKVPVTADTVLDLASISKVFTAMSVFLAAQQGKLSLDDEVQKYVPEWIDRDDHITIRHLVSHTSGVRDAFTLLGWVPGGYSTGDTNAAIVNVLARQRGLNFPPGAKFEYNNGGYNLLASILKRGTGQSLGAFAAANIFKPLGMTHTSFGEDATTPKAARAGGYTRQSDGWHVVLGQPGPAVVGNAGMYSTVGDLLIWLENFDHPRVGTPEMFAAMQKQPVLKDGTTSSYGTGLPTSEYRGLSAFEFSGGGPGVATKVMRFPKQRFAVAVLCNVDSVVVGGPANPDVFTNGVADIYLADVLRPAAVASTAPAPSAPVKLTDAELSEKAGLYRGVDSGVDVPVLFTVNHGRMMFRSYFHDDSDFELTPVGGNRFMFLSSTAWEFVPATAGRPKEWHAGPAVAQAVTLTASAPELRAYAGNYRSDEIGALWTLEVGDSRLNVKNTWPPNQTISPFMKDAFAGDIVGVVKFSRNSRGAVTGFTVNRASVNGLRFDRVK
jgi:CubicO group peptidase (beta-lactamase class C family)